MKFVAYHRVSLERQGLNGLGIEAQRQAVARYLATLDCELIGTFDEVESGANNKRPQLAAAIQLAKAKKAILVIAKLDRLSRNAAFLLQLQDSGVDFVACDMPNADKLSIGIIALLAQRERQLISERTKAGLAVAKQRGVTLGNPNAKQALKVAHKAIQGRKLAFVAEAMKSIEEIRETGVQTLAKIADCLNKRGEKTARNGKWTATAVKRVMEAVA
ncbi:MAG TPA: recombinase family protein [Candidatus Paceibacterota bacterium]|nr:recombinase family protein [Candidatus Paceibacterota bacterium]HRT55078.1 recombinase family protein [Candidatus Paceibacterota bacterium]